MDAKPILRGFERGFQLSYFSIPETLRIFQLNSDWAALDAGFQRLCLPGGAFFEFLQLFYSFSTIEFIISIRDSDNEWEEDGIWHDDGSRVFAFSLSITPDAEDLEGGHLEIRKKSDFENEVQIPTPKFGQVILFLTGRHGFEHRTRAVKKGRRVVIAGWCA